MDGCVQVRAWVQMQLQLMQALSPVYVQLQALAQVLVQMHAGVQQEHALVVQVQTFVMQQLRVTSPVVQV
jgi:hypothetical protein